MPRADDAFQWTPFTHGYVFWEHSTPEHRPPGPDDIEGLHQWLEGFELSHTDHPDIISDPSDRNVEEAGESVAEALSRLLVDHPSLPTLLAMRRPMTIGDMSMDMLLRKEKGARITRSLPSFPS